MDSLLSDVELLMKNFSTSGYFSSFFFWGVLLFPFQIFGDEVVSSEVENGVFADAASPGDKKASPLPPTALPRAIEDARQWDRQDLPLLYAPKYIAFSDDLYLSFGADFRLRFDGIENRNFQEEEFRPGTFQRWMTHGEVGTQSFRGFVQLKGTLAQGPGPIRGIDADPLAMHQAFGELRDRQLGEWTFRLRAGRMELSEGRLLSLREGPNMRISYDGAWSEFRRENLIFRAMYLQPVEINPGIFDNRSRWSNHLWRGSAAWTIWSEDQDAFRLEATYQEGYRLAQRYYRGTGEERRRTVGLRVDLQRTFSPGRFSLDLEAFGQMGRFEDLPIRAYRLAMQTRWSFENQLLSPALLLTLDQSSGDGGDQSATLGTFQAYVPRGSYFSEFSFLAPSNLRVIAPGFEVSPGPLTLRLDLGRFWRTSTFDGLYSLGMVPFFERADAGGSLVGDLLGLSAAWQLHRLASLHGGAVLFLPGDYTEPYGGVETIRYLTTWLILRY